MLHKKTPSENGWYWVELDGDLWMGYLLAEADTPMLLLAPFADGCNQVDIERAGELWRLVQTDELGWVDPNDGCGYGQPSRWIGPLSCPAGPFGSEIAEFTVERHEEAEKQGKSLIMVHADIAEDKGVPGCQLRTTGLVGGKEAYARVAGFFREREK